MAARLNAVDRIMMILPTLGIAPHDNIHGKRVPYSAITLL